MPMAAPLQVRLNNRLPVTRQSIYDKAFCLIVANFLAETEPPNRRAAALIMALVRNLPCSDRIYASLVPTA